jgi:hypothetical protein
MTKLKLLAAVRCHRTYKGEAIPLFPFEEVPQGL